MKPGTRVGPYELLAPIGAGGMGEVWKARDTRLDRTVAIKFSKAAFGDRFQREARAIAALNHPNIATLHDVGDNYIVMEYVDGEPVRPPGDTRKMLDIAVQIADGLAAAHAAGIVHRDLKPDNVLLTKGGRVKILDFGLAKQTVKPAQDEATMTVVTDPGTVMGTVAYMSPEQARGQELDARSDQFSFGLILYELAAGKRAFQRPTAAETMTAIIREEPEPLPPAAPAPLQWTVERCLAKDPADRYGSTRDLYLEVRGLVARITQASAASTVSLTATKRRGWGLGAAVLAAMVGAIFALTWLRVEEPVGDRLQLTPIAVEKDHEDSPKFSPDGRAIAFLRTIDRERHVFVRNSDTGTTTRVTRPGEGVRWLLSWSRDGQTIYAVAGQREYPFATTLLAVSASGGSPRRILCGARSQAGRWLVSPNEDSIITVEPVSLSNGARQYRLLQWPFGGGPAKPLADLPIRATAELWMGAFSPDGTKLLFTCSNGPAIVISYPGGTLREVPSIPNTSQVAWMPDSRHAVFSTVAPRFRNDLVMADTEGTARRVVLSGIQEVAGDPAVSPSGKQIAVVRAELDFDLLEFNVEGAYAGELRASAVIEGASAWSPRGTAYVHGEDGVGIWVRDADGRNARLLVPGHASGGASWSPDGRRLAFKASGGVFAMLAEGGPRTVLVPTTDFRIPGATCWSPDGLWVAYSRLAPAGGQLVKVSSTSGQQPVELVRDRVVNNSWANCSWSPDGESIAYRAADGIRVVASGGGESRLIAAGRSAQFMPDGRLLALTVDDDPPGAFLATLDPRSGRRLSNARLVLPEAYPPAAVQAFAVHPGGKRVAISAGKSNSDIFLVEHFAEPVPGWRRFFHRWETPAGDGPKR